MEERDIMGLYTRLDSMVSLSRKVPDEIDAHSEKEWQIHLHISLANGTGDVAEAPPMVPG